MSRSQTPVYSPDPLIPLTQAAELLAIDPCELRRMVSARQIAVVRRSPRGHVKIRHSEIERWIAAHTIPARRDRAEA